MFSITNKKVFLFFILFFNFSIKPNDFTRDKIDQQKEALLKEISLNKMQRYIIMGSGIIAGTVLYNKWRRGDFSTLSTVEYEDLIQKLNIVNKLNNNIKPEEQANKIVNTGIGILKSVFNTIPAVMMQISLPVAINKINSYFAPRDINWIIKDNKIFININNLNNQVILLNSELSQLEVSNHLIQINFLLEDLERGSLRLIGFLELKADEFDINLSKEESQKYRLIAQNLFPVLSELYLKIKLNINKISENNLQKNIISSELVELLNLVIRVAQAHNILNNLISN